MKKLKEALTDLQCELVAERTRVNPQNISWLQYDILHQLEKQETILPSELSAILGISRTKLSKSLKSLKILGYIQQIPNKSDGRELYTSISTEGKDLLKKISAGHQTLYESALNSLSEEEQLVFANLSIRVSERLRKERIKAYE